MDQGRAEVDVKNGDQEHTMHKEPREDEDWYIHGSSQLAKAKYNTKREQEKYS